MNNKSLHFKYKMFFVNIRQLSINPASVEIAGHYRLKHTWLGCIFCSSPRLYVVESSCPSISTLYLKYSSRYFLLEAIWQMHIICFGYIYSRAMRTSQIITNCKRVDESAGIVINYIVLYHTTFVYMLQWRKLLLCNEGADISWRFCYQHVTHCFWKVMYY